MRLIRKIMQDRSSAGAIAMLALLLFLLQGLTNGVANGSMAAMALSADEIICSSHMPDGASGKQDPAGKLANNCCGTLCRLATASAITLPAVPTEPVIGFALTLQVSFQHAEAKRSPQPPNRESQPRAPPSALQTLSKASA
ncbi:DUF2946 family protein [Agrobacterium rosae]|uniref:DUF2946 domain-containing protein n=1 Tax=Agrobacterium rosae TaxID=1972867 RepID=A0A1R3U521_9HYPH|nr:DUF2946 family protein [Agrobacterium rosae]SCX35005.1 hypothetical protein DSM25559_4728 [Agrobacterium rosae]